jgi:hypothetical protein
MPVNVAGKPLSNGALAVGGGPIVALVASFLPWHSTSLPAGYICPTCGPNSPYIASYSAFGYWPGWVFFIAVLAGIAFFVLRSFVPQVTIPALPFSDAMIYSGIGVLMLLCALLWLVTGGGYAREYVGLSTQGPIVSSPGFGVFIAIIAAAALSVGGYLMRAEPQPATKPMSSYQSPASPAAPPPPSSASAPDDGAEGA